MGLLCLLIITHKIRILFDFLISFLVLYNSKCNIQLIQLGKQSEQEGESKEGTEGVIL